MSEPTVSEPWLLLARAGGVGLVLRVMIAVSALVALGGTLLAADQDLPVVKFVIVAAAMLCVVFPDGPLGLVVVVLIGVEWLVTVDDPTTPWSIPVAAALAVFHTSMAASAVIPPSASWTPAMRRRWVRRCSILMALTPLTWVLVVAFDQRQAATSQVLVAASVLILALAGVWARAGSLTGRRPDSAL